jgi:photosystem II stability/assembly factor-like uncharacterized protein
LNSNTSSKRIPIIVKYLSVFFAMEEETMRDKFVYRTALLGLIFVLGSLFSAAQEEPADKIDSSYFSGLKVRSIGPAGMSGRIACVDVMVDNPRIIYVGSATGGIWKSTNSGVTWKPIFDDQTTSSIGDLTIDPDNSEVVWVGTGEANPRNSAGVGRGVFKTLNGGETWEFLGLEKTERISRLLLDPNDPDTAFVAALGTTWGENPERGVFKSIDSGKTWKKVLFVDERTGAADLVMDPSNPNRLLAAMWEYKRWPWFFNSGGPGSGLYLSIDGGETWKKLSPEEGLPEGNLGRIGIAFSRSRPNIVYALVEAEKSALCRSEDGGETWTVVNDKPGVSPRPFYYSDIRVHPKQENTVYRLSSPLDISIDGGKTFKRLMPFFAIHGDFHELWIHPKDSDFMVVGGDGGIGLSYDAGKHWNFVQNLPLAQFYHISVDLENPYNIYGGLQDNGSWRGPSRVLQGRAIFNFNWQPVGWGDGFGTLPVPGNPKVGYSMSQGGWLVRFNTVTGELKDIRPPEPEGIKLRFNWNSAIALDPLDSNILYYGSQFLHRSRDQGQTWQIISPDLTTNSPGKQQQSMSGGLTRDVTNAENHCTILTIAPSPVLKGVIWVGTDDGKVQLTRNGGSSWKDLSEKFTGMKEGGVLLATWCPHIEASFHSAATAYVVFDDHRRANWTPYVYMTEDYGETWTNLVTPDIDGFVHVLREDPVQKNLLFLGTEFGLYVSFDRGKSWMKWTQGLPTVPVRDMIIHPFDNDLVVGTHGRAVYILDDILPLREFTPEIKKKNLHIFSIDDAYQFRTSFLSPGYLTPGNMEFQGQNKPYGALITYSIGERKDQSQGERQTESTLSGQEAESQNDDQRSLKIEIMDSMGEIVRTLKGSNEPGLQRINWDLRYEPFKSLSDSSESMFPPSGPYVLPGTYKARIKLDDDAFEETFQVIADPRYPVTNADRKSKYELIMRNGKFIEAVATAYEKIEKALKALEEVLNGIDTLEEKQRETIRIRTNALKEMLQAIKLHLSPPKDRSGIYEETELSSRLSTLQSRLESSFDAPTEGELQEFEQIKNAFNREIIKLNTFFREDFPNFIKEVKEAGFTIFPDIGPTVIKF